MFEDQSMPDNRYCLGPINLDHPKITHDFQIILTGTGKKVLEFGPASGYISKILKERDCKVTAIEISPILAKQASEFVERIIVGDAETLDLDRILGIEKFDVILMGDFLEHMKEPIQLLKKIRKFLTDDGYIVCSIPNIAHASVRLKLLNGEFKYESTGLLDETHLRFFTLDTILYMLDASGYSINKLYRGKEEINLATRTDLKHYVIPEELMESILRDTEATTFQYIFSAKPSTISNTTVRKWLSEFPKNIVTERLKETLDYYKRDLLGILEQRIQEKDLEINKLQKELLDNLRRIEKNYVKDSTDLNMREVELEIRIHYRDELEREPDDAGLQYFLNKIKSGEMSLEEVKHTISNSPEASSRKQRKYENNKISKYPTSSTIDEFHKIYYGTESSHIWVNTNWLGHQVLKCPLDLWIYQEIILDTKPDFIIETGTWNGGSAIFLATICNILDNGHVITIDTDKRNMPQHERITYVTGSSVDDTTVNQIKNMVGKNDKIMVILDSEHSKSHVLKEMEIYGKMVSIGNYLIVEDTNVNGHPVLPEFGEGPMEAVKEFLKDHNDFVVDKEREKFLMTFNPNGYLKKIKK